MATSLGATKRPDGDLEPAWEIAYLFPAQGAWSEDDYLSLTEGTNHLVELSQGHVEVLPMPTRTHQRIVFFLARVLHRFLMAHGLGTVLFAPCASAYGKANFVSPISSSCWQSTAIASTTRISTAPIL